MPVWWTKRSLPGSSGVMKPKPLSSLNHLTVPVAISGSLLGIRCCDTGGCSEGNDSERWHDLRRDGSRLLTRSRIPSAGVGVHCGAGPPARGRRPRGRSGLRGLRVRPDDDRVGDRDDLVDREAGARGVLADGLRARGLVDADGADRAAALVEDVGADPADVVGHLLVADLGRPARGLLELGAGAPAATAQDRVELHVVCLRVVACEYAVDTTPAAAAAHRTGSLSFDDPEAGAAAPASPRLRTSSLRRIAQTWWPGLLRDEQAPGDVGVAPPLCDEGEHFDLPRREPRRVRARGAVRPAADVAQAALAQRPG